MLTKNQIRNMIEEARTLAPKFAAIGDAESERDALEYAEDLEALLGVTR